MLSFLLTLNRVVVGSYIKSATILKSFPIEDDKDFYSVILDNWKEIVESYAHQVEQSGKRTPDIVPLTFLYSKDFLSSKKERFELLKQWIDYQTIHPCRLFMETEWMNMFIKGFNVHKPNQKSFYALEGIENQVVLYSSFEGTYTNITSFPQFGIQSGRENILRAIKRLLKKQGVLLDSEAESSVLHQIKKWTFRKPIHFERKSATISINGGIQLTEDKYHELIAVGKEVIQPFVNVKTLQSADCNLLVSIGDYFNNKFIQIYLLEQIGVNFEYVHIGTYQAYYTAFFGSFRSIVEEIKADRRDRSIGFRNKIQEQDNFLQQLTAVHIEQADWNTALEENTQKGLELGIPTVVTSWHLRQNVLKNKATRVINTLYNPDIEEFALLTLPHELSQWNEQHFELLQLPENSSVPFSEPEYNLYGDDHTEQVFDIVGERMGDSDAVSDTQNLEKSLGNEEVELVDLQKDIDIEEELQGEMQILNYYNKNNPWHFSAQNKANKKIKVFRFLEKDNATFSINEFKKMYQIENSYFEKVSYLMQTENGIYYYRDYINGLDLEEFLKEIGFFEEQKKSAFRKKSYKYLKEVENYLVTLPFQFRIRKGDIIFKKVKGFFSTKYIPIMVGIKLEICTKQEMMESWNTLLEDKHLYHSQR